MKRCTPTAALCSTTSSTTSSRAKQSRRARTGIAGGLGAGGHAGTLSPFALVQEVREWWDGPIALSGAIGSGHGVAAAVAAGADFAYVGSPFIATHEANASEAYKNAIVEGSAEDIVYSNLFTGVHGNYLKASVRAAGLDPDALPESDPSAMDFSGLKAWKDIWGCGRGIDGVKDGEYSGARRPLPRGVRGRRARVAAYGMSSTRKRLGCCVCYYDDDAFTASGACALPSAACDASRCFSIVIVSGCAPPSTRLAIRAVSSSEKRLVEIVERGAGVVVKHRRVYRPHPERELAFFRERAASQVLFAGIWLLRMNIRGSSAYLRRRWHSLRVHAKKGRQPPARRALRSPRCVKAPSIRN